MSDIDEAAQVTATIGDSEGKPKREFDKGFTRNMKIIGGFLALVIVAVVIVVLMSSGGSKKNQGNVSLDTGMAQGQVKREDPTPAMQNMLRDAQLVEAEKARREGRSYVPAEAIGQTQPVSPVPDQQTAMPASTMQNSVNNVHGGPANNTEEMRRVRTALDTQLAQIFPSTVNAQGAVRQSVDYREKASSDQKSGASSSIQSVAANTVGQSSGGATLIALNEIYTARLANPVTVAKGKSSYASAVLISGPYAGAFLTGTATLNENETIEIALNKMRIGKTGYTVDAIGLDEMTADAGINGSIDRRILQRWVIPIGVAMAQGYFTASSLTGTQVTSGTGGVLASSTPAPTIEQARNAGLASGMQIAQREVQQAAQAPILASTPPNVTIGVLFRAEVKEGQK